MDIPREAKEAGMVNYDQDGSDASEAVYGDINFCIRVYGHLLQSIK